MTIVVTVFSSAEPTADHSASRILHEIDLEFRQATINSIKRTVYWYYYGFQYKNC